jgi:hypothetical protein
MENKKIPRTVLGRLLAHGMALLAQPSGQGTRASPHQRHYGARPRCGRHAQHALGGALIGGPAMTCR